jgi:hypothetical protein
MSLRSRKSISKFWDPLSGESLEEKLEGAVEDDSVIPQLEAEGTLDATPPASDLTLISETSDSEGDEITATTDKPEDDTSDFPIVRDIPSVSKAANVSGSPETSKSDPSSSDTHVCAPCSMACSCPPCQVNYPSCQMTCYVPPAREGGEKTAKDEEISPKKEELTKMLFVVYAVLVTMLSVPSD